MPIPMGTNTTCDIYRFANVPPAAPDVAGQPCFLQGCFDRMVEQGESLAAAYRHTHIMFIGSNVDIRDAYANGSFQASAADHVWVPDKNGTRFNVIFIQKAGTAAKKVYIQRQAPTWPTNEL